MNVNVLVSSCFLLVNTPSFLHVYTEDGTAKKRKALKKRTEPKSPSPTTVSHQMPAFSYWALYSASYSSWKARSQRPSYACGNHHLIYIIHSIRDYL